MKDENIKADPRRGLSVSSLSLKPGARLVREWHGHTHIVTVTEDGFECAGMGKALAPRPRAPSCRYKMSTTRNVRGLVTTTVRGRNSRLRREAAERR
jgi:hypothetical protein